MKHNGILKNSTMRLVMVILICLFVCSQIVGWIFANKIINTKQPEFIPLIIAILGASGILAGIGIFLKVRQRKYEKPVEEKLEDQNKDGVNE